MKKNDDKNYFKLNPDFITGLTDAEGCFSVYIRKYKRAKFKRNARIEFNIKMLENEIELLTMVKSFFNCGNLWHYIKDGSV